MPNTFLFEAREFFPGSPVGGPLVSENFARALFHLAHGNAEVKTTAAGFAVQIFEHYFKSVGMAPRFPEALLLLYSLKHDEFLPLLIAVSVDESPRIIFGLLSDVRPIT